MRIISCNFECPFLQHPIFGDSVPISYTVENDTIKFDLDFPISGKVKIVYETEDEWG